MNLAHLYYFRKLVEVNNYSQAAKELFIAQPTLSLAISSLEKELGTTLIGKKRNSIGLTEDGESFYQAVLVATNALDNAVSTIHDRVSAESGSIRVGMVYSIQSQAWSAAIREYHDACSGTVRINWKQGTTETLMKDLKDGSLDVIMAGTLGSDPEVESIPSFTQSLKLLVNDMHPLSQRKNISLDELKGQRVITYRSNKGPFVNEISSLLAKHQHLNVVCEYTDEITLASLVAADPNVMALSCHSWLINAFPSVTAVTVDEAPEDFHRFFVSYRARERHPHAVGEFIEFMKNYDFTNVSPRESADQEYLIGGLGDFSYAMERTED